LSRTMQPTALNPSSSVPTSSNSPRRQRLDELQAEIVALATQLTAACAGLTRLIGEFDAAEGCGEWGMRSTAHWLSWHCGMGLGAAREHVRVARALSSLPVISAEYATGGLSYAKVRALTRFATPESDAYLASMGRHATGAQIERLARAARRARTGEEARGQYAAAYLKITIADDGSVHGSFQLPPAEGAELVQALEAGAGRLPDYASEGEPAEQGDGRHKQVAPRGYASVLSAMAREYLDSLIRDATPQQAERFQVVLHATAEQLARPDTDDQPTLDGLPEESPELGSGAHLHPSTARRLSCDCPALTIVTDEDGIALHVGRRRRRVGRRQRRAIEIRDRGRCRAPGCTKPATQIHHIRHWANGGPTCLPNLISLCDHWLAHEGGFTIVTRSLGRWALSGPTGVTVEPYPPTPQPAGSLQLDATLSADGVTGHWDGRPMNHYAIEVILTPIGAFEPRPPLQLGVSAETSAAA
jgi:uncharacterized protein DUF222/HNH endonuclease